MIDVLLDHVIDFGSAYPRFLASWCKTERWLNAFEHAVPQLQALIDLTRLVDDNTDAWRSQDDETQRWIIESLAWMQTVIAGAVRDGWVQPVFFRGTRTPSICQSPGIQSPATASVDQTAGDQECEHALLAAHRSGDLSISALHRCLKWMHPSQIYPKREMKTGDVRLGPDATHQAWCVQLANQSGDHQGLDLRLHTAINTQARQHTARARAHIGQGRYDSPVGRTEMQSIVCKWDDSPSMPADLTPRAAFQCSHALWNLCVWLLQRITGPGGLAIRPDLWRLATLLAIHKRGPPDQMDNFRLIFVKIQMGLLQETILSRRLSPPVRVHLAAGQSGYIRGTEDPILLLHELCSLRLRLNLCTWYSLGDFQKAFPRVWRADLLNLAHGVPEFRDGAYALLADILKVDQVHVWLSGCSEVTIVEGVPEGGNIGTLTYILVPDSLIKELFERGFGVGVGFAMPEPWQEHLWSGRGRPIPELVEELLHCIVKRECLPSSKFLRLWPDLEASAAKALDLTAPVRIPAIFHADDPVLLSSSMGELENLLEVVASWGQRHNAKFHLGPSKTVVMVSAPNTCKPEDADVQVHMRSADTGSLVRLSYRVSHKWLGIHWHSDLVFDHEREAKLGAAGDVLSGLAGFVGSGSVPLHLAIPLFDIKVDSVLTYSRWLFVGQPGAEVRFNEIYESWARLLLGASPWRNGAVATGEVGWYITGYARVVRDAALRLARIQMSPDDLYHRVFNLATDHGCGWTLLCKEQIAGWNVHDWSSWSAVHPCCGDYSRYLQIRLAGQCLPEWRRDADKHTAQVPYLQIQCVPGAAIRDFGGQVWSWQVATALRGWCRMRAGLITLRHLNGKLSRARYQACVLCGAYARNGTRHVIGKCHIMAARRNSFLLLSTLPLDASADAITGLVLRCSPRHASFMHAVLMCGEIDAAVARFWRDRSRTIEL